MQAMLDKRMEVSDIEHVPFEAGLRKKLYGGITYAGHTPVALWPGHVMYRALI
jgi:hypothetical protein